MNEELSNIYELEKDVECDRVNEDKYFLYSRTSNAYAYVSFSSFLVLEQIDGHRSVGEITDILTDNKSTKKDYERVLGFIDVHLGKSGFLKGQKGTNKSSIKFNRLVLGEDLTDKISSVLCRLFCKKVCIPFYAISSTVIGFLIYAIEDPFALANASPSYAGMVTASIFLFFAHELGHSSAMRKYGLSAKGIGFGFYFFTPVMYADVSDAWKLTERQRVVVDLGGFYFQSILTSLYLVCSICFNVPTLLYVVYLSLFMSVFNFNPFIKSDLYWAISDFFETPNLREQSIEELKSVFCRSNPGRINFMMALYGFLCHAFMATVVCFVLKTSCSSVVTLIKGEYSFTFWNVERDLLVAVSLFFFVHEIKGIGHNMIKSKK